MIADEAELAARAALAAIGQELVTAVAEPESTASIATRAKAAIERVMKLYATRTRSVAGEFDNEPSSTQKDAK